MSGPVIIAREVTKRFVTWRKTSASLKEMVVRNWLDRGERIEHTTLDAISFEIERGHTFAVVGNNGSGKSTLLRLLAGIMEPTEGTLEVRGRVAAMIELGAGFHPDLTGMENIFLVGSVLGLTREQILARLDPIQEFAELGDFIHTPVRRYSSGMLVRLGFAIALQSDAEIFLLDEILAVGDGYFQRKSLRAIEQLRRRGCTIFFVSHDLEMVEAIADRVLWLERGKARMLGPADEVLDAVFDATQAAVREVSHAVAASHDEQLNERTSVAFASYQGEGAEARILAVRLLDPQGRESRVFETSAPLAFEIDFETRVPLADGLTVNISVGSQGGMHAAHFEDARTASEAAAAPGRYRLRVEFPRIGLHPGRYVATVCLAPESHPERWYDLHLRLYPFTLRAPGETLAGIHETLAPAPGAWE